MSSYIPEGPPAAPLAAESSPPLLQIMMLTADALAHLITELCPPAPEPRLPEMPAKGHSTALKFDEDPVNLQSFFTELEHHFTQYQIRDNIVQKEQCLRYLNAMTTDVWAGVTAYEDNGAPWKEFKEQVYKLYPDSGIKQNLANIITYMQMSAAVAYPNE